MIFLVPISRSFIRHPLLHIPSKKVVTSSHALTKLTANHYTNAVGYIQAYKAHFQGSSHDVVTITLQAVLMWASQRAATHQDEDMAATIHSLLFNTLTFYTPIIFDTLFPIVVTFDNLETFLRALKDQDTFDVCVLILCTIATPMHDPVNAQLSFSDHRVRMEKAEDLVTRSNVIYMETEMAAGYAEMFFCNLKDQGASEDTVKAGTALIQQVNNLHSAAEDFDWACNGFVDDLQLQYEAALARYGKVLPSDGTHPEDDPYAQPFEGPVVGDHEAWNGAPMRILVPAEAFKKPAIYTLAVRLFQAVKQDSMPFSFDEWPPAGVR
jgi:hypothetical protein